MLLQTEVLVVVAPGGLDLMSSEWRAWDRLCWSSPPRLMREEECDKIKNDVQVDWNSLCMLALYPDKRVLETSANNIFCWEVLSDPLNILFCWCCMITPCNKLILLCFGMKGRNHTYAPSLMLEWHFDLPAVFTYSYLSCGRCIKFVSLFPLYFLAIAYTRGAV